LRLSLPSRRNRPPATVRPAIEADRAAIADLISNARWKHQHLDWADTLGVIAEQPLLAAYEGTRLIGAMGFPPDPPGVAWLRLFAVAQGQSPKVVWNRMWPRASLLATQIGIEDLAALDIGGWLHSLLESSGFHQTTEVMFMEWNGSHPPDPTRPIDGLRTLEYRDLPELAGLDSRAFGPIWQHSQKVLALALRQASLASVVERKGRLVAYQISTSSAFGAHLARLAVDPAWQHQGIGSDLVIEVLRRFAMQGFLRITLNTQADNERSLRLYRRLGFSETGQRFPVYQTRLGRPTEPSTPPARDLPA
jgi:ribosomal-protein-alanine N-acetyltransferase